MRKSSTTLTSAAMLAMLSACNEAELTTDRYESSGEVIAYSGGDAGARGACVTCHGLKGEGDGNLVPRLAGLDPGYQLRQLEYFSEGQRRHPQMVWIADHLDWPAREKVSNYYAQLPLPEGAAPAPDEGDCAAAELYHRGDPARGLDSCASCHGDRGGGRGVGNPPLSAQPATYLEAQLKAWANGERYGGDNTMTRISQLLTEAERARLAGYSSTLPGAFGYPEPPESCPRTRRPDPSNGA